MNEQITAKLLPVKTKLCRHGTFTFYPDDMFIGLALDQYGEYSELEVFCFEKVLREGDIVVEVGANIGTLTVPIAKIVGPTGQVVAIEPNRQNFNLLKTNIENNDLSDRVRVLCAAASSKQGTINIPGLEELGHKNYGRVEVGSGSDVVDTITIDSLEFHDDVVMIKIDVEGHELEVLRGARETIKRCQPIIYVENDRDEKSVALIAELVDMGYRLYWFRPSLWNPNNYTGEKRNIFSNIVSLNMFCVPEESKIKVNGLDEVADIRLDSQIFEREAIRFSRRVERLPDDLMSRLLAAHYHNLMRRPDVALDLLEENLRRDPDHVASVAVRGLIRMQQGDYKRGWQDYELRQLQPSKRYFGGHRKFPVPQWDGKITDAVVLVSAQQGYGDNIMFGRYFKYVLVLAPNAILEVPAELYEVFEQSRVAPEGRLFRYGRTLPHYDFYVPSPSLPATLGDDGSLIEIDRPYLFADDLMISNWKERNPPKFGMCLKGSPNSERPYTRNCPVDLFDKILRDHGPYFQLENIGQFESFADTAAAIMNLDLVITVDTSVAHLSGALGQRTWLLLSYDPDWRWGLEGNKTLWYPTMRIFRQSSVYDWSNVISELEEAMAER